MRHAWPGNNSRNETGMSESTKVGAAAACEDGRTG